MSTESNDSTNREINEETLEVSSSTESDRIEEIFNKIKEKLEDVNVSISEGTIRNLQDCLDTLNLYTDILRTYHINYVIKEG